METTFPEFTRKPSESYTWANLENYHKQLDIKLGPFTQKELDSVLRKIKNRKAAGLDEIPQKYGRPGNSTTYCSDTVISYIIKTQ